jgi:hypothetical protein
VVAEVAIVILQIAVTAQTEVFAINALIAIASDRFLTTVLTVHI